MIRDLLNLLLPPICCSQSSSNERNAFATLKTFASAQADFRANDRDGNGLEDFWREDVAGLYLLPGSEGQAIKLIEISAAGADDRSVADISPYLASFPKAGYWFRAIRHADESEFDPARFAFCSFPSAYGQAGRMTFILDERNTVYQRDLGRPGGIDLYPADPTKEGWTRLD